MPLKEIKEKILEELEKAEKALSEEYNLTQKTFYEGYIKGLKFNKHYLSEAMKEVREKASSMYTKQWIEHGRDCEEGKRPCGAVEKPEKLADRCQILSYDRKTIDDILAYLEEKK